MARASRIVRDVIARESRNDAFRTLFESSRAGILKADVTSIAVILHKTSPVLAREWVGFCGIQYQMKARQLLQDVILQGDVNTEALSTVAEKLADYSGTFLAEHDAAKLVQDTWKTFDSRTQEAAGAE